MSMSMPSISFKLLLFTAYVAKLNYVWAHGPNAPTWARTVPHGHELKTVLQFYFHEISTGDDATIQLIAQAQPSSTNSTTDFGDLYMADDPHTVGPDLNSKLVGRAQGFYGSVSHIVWSYLMGLTYNFVDGIYNGSSLTILGLNSISNPVREYPVVGETGLFQMAHGYVLAQIYFFSPTLGIVIVGYNVTVFHP